MKKSWLEEYADRYEQSPDYSSDVTKQGGNVTYRQIQNK